jgi:hypothetical protein
VGPAKLRKLILVGALLEQKDKGAEADRPCDESLERVLIGDVANSRGCQVDHLYMLLQDLAIDKIDADEEKVPVEKSKHWQSLVLFPVPLELFDRTSKDTWIISRWHEHMNSGHHPLSCCDVAGLKTQGWIFGKMAAGKLEHHLNRSNANSSLAGNGLGSIPPESP